MYKFIDTTEASESALLPSEALKINGEYIEDIVPGYRTLTVSGREALSPEIDAYETGVRDGSVLKSKRYPARTIIVQYQLIAESNEAFRVAYNKLARVLDVENAELIFNDEADKFFIGTPSAIGEVEPGRNAVIGEFEIFCADPFKYSTAIYEAMATYIPAVTEEGEEYVEHAFWVDYKGTYKSYPTFEAKFFSENEVSSDGTTVQKIMGLGDCGYLAFINENSKILQFGNPEEVDGIKQPKSQTLVNQKFWEVEKWDSAMESLWLLNNGISAMEQVEQTGTAGFRLSSEHTGSRNVLSCIDYGAGAGWHGCFVTRNVPADSSGYVGASRCVLTYDLNIACNTISAQDTRQQRGAFQALLVSGSGSTRKVVAGIAVVKGNDTSKGRLEFYVNNQKVQTIEIDLSLRNKYFGLPNNGVSAIKTCIIKKDGGTITFDAAGFVSSFYVSELEDVDVTQITFSFLKYGNGTSRTQLPHNSVSSVNFVKHNCPILETPNTFGCGDTFSADCRNAEVKHNNLSAPEIGALGNDWEDFYLKPGVNQIGVAYSDWLEEDNDDVAPELKMKYREVFL